MITISSYRHIVIHISLSVSVVYESSLIMAMIFSILIYSALLLTRFRLINRCLEKIYG